MSAKETRSLVKRVGFSFFTLFVAFLIVEGVFRLLGLRGFHYPRTREWNHALLEEQERIPGVRIQFRPNTSFDLCYDSNPREYFDDNNCLTYRLNNFGFRGGDIRLEKDPDVLRVLMVGDSITFGEGVRLEDTFCTRLEALLATEMERKVEIYNFGVSSWGTWDEAYFMTGLGKRFEADLALFVYVLNDPDYPAGLDVWENYKNVYEKWKLRHSYFLSFFYARVARPIMGKKLIDRMVYGASQIGFRWDRSFNHLQEAKLAAEEAGMRFAVAVMPFMFDLSEENPFQPLHDRVIDGCKEREIIVRDLLPSFFGNRHMDLWVHPSDQHPNEIGHEIAANALFDFIMAENLLAPSE